MGLRNLANPKAPSLPEEMRPQAVSAAELCARSGSTGKEGEVWCSLKGRLPPEENPQGLDSGKGTESEENIKRNFVLFVHDIHIHVPQAVWRKEWVFFKKKKKSYLLFPSKQRYIVVTWRGWRLLLCKTELCPEGLYLLSTNSSQRVAPRKVDATANIHSSLEPQPNLEWLAQVGVRDEVLDPLGSEGPPGFGPQIKEVLFSRSFLRWKKAHHFVSYLLCDPSNCRCNLLLDSVPPLLIWSIGNLEKNLPSNHEVSKINSK